MSTFAEIDRHGGPPAPRLVLVAPVALSHEPRSAGELFLHRYADGLSASGVEVTVVAPVVASERRPLAASCRLVTLPASNVSRSMRRALAWPLDVLRAPTAGIAFDAAFRTS